MEIIKCVECGKEFDRREGSGRKTRYCSEKCRRKYNNRLNNERLKGIYATKPIPRGKKPKYSIAQINDKARKEGLSYGEYMTKHGY